MKSKDTATVAKLRARIQEASGSKAVPQKGGDAPFNELPRGNKGLSKVHAMRGRE